MNKLGGNPEERARGRNHHGLATASLISVIVLSMVSALVFLESRADAAGAAVDELSSIGAMTHELDSLSIELLRLRRQAPGETWAGLETDADLLQSQVALRLNHLTKNDVASRFLGPVIAAFQAFSAEFEEGLALRLGGQKVEAARLDMRTVDPAVGVLMAAVKTAVLQVHRIGEATSRLRDIGSVATLLIGGAILALVSWRTTRSRRRFHESVARTTALEQSERRFHSLMAESSDFITVLDRDGLVTFQSTSVEHLLGWRPEQIVGRDIREFLDPDDARGVETLLRRAEEPEHARQATEWRIRKADGKTLTVEAIAVAKFDEPDINGVLVNVRDLSERLVLEDALRDQAFHDGLTKLANRILFEDRLEHALDRTKRSGHDLGVLLLDLDFFKDINDAYGHAVGDQVLVEVAERLREATRPEDTIARLGGDEFAILIEEMTEQDGARVAQRVIDTVGKPLEIERADIYLRVSVGIVSATANDRLSGRPGREQIMAEADLAMYEAKRQGRGRFQFFAPAMQEGVRERLTLKAELERALIHHELVLHYQPIVSIDSSTVVGAEALVRWQHPERGLIAPMDFIPLAEQTGIIIELGRWVLQEACAEAATWSHAGEAGPYVSVNVAGLQLQQVSFVREIQGVLQETGLDPGRLVIEVTETALIEDSDRNEQKLQQLREIGVRLAIDDFGTGYSSLSYLRRFNMDILKIDKSFVDGIGPDSKESSLVSAMVAMGTSLSMQVVAEGIEEPEQLEGLRELNCELGQGFLFAKPVPAADLHALLSKHALAPGVVAGAA